MVNYIMVKLVNSLNGKFRNIKSFKNLNDLKGNMDEISNSAILIKGSRGMKLENILDFI